MTTPQGSQTSQSRSDVFSTATEHLNTESDAKSVNAELVAEHRYESFSSREIIPERSVDLNAEDGEFLISSRKVT